MATATKAVGTTKKKTDNGIGNAKSIQFGVLGEQPTNVMVSDTMTVQQLLTAQNIQFGEQEEFAVYGAAKIGGKYQQLTRDSLVNGFAIVVCNKPSGGGQ